MSSMNDQHAVAQPRTKVLWIRQPFLDQILSGRKTVEVRVGYPNILRLKPGDRLKLNDQHLATLQHIRVYGGFEELLAREDPLAVAPDMPSGDLLPALRRLYPPDKEALGAVALELALCPYDAVLFDMGYTLVYFQPLQEVIVQEALRDVGVERSVDDIKVAVSVVWGGYYRDVDTMTFPATPEHDRQTELALSRGLLAHLGLGESEELLDTYRSSIEARFLQPGVIRPYPEVIAMLETLKGQGYRLGIVSNWSWNLRDRVAQVGLDTYFEVVWASAYAGCNKPHPDIFYQALARMDSPPIPDRTLYVGDSYRHDVVGARNAGLNPVLIDRDGSGRDRDCLVISNLSELFPLLSESLSES